MALTTYEGLLETWADGIETIEQNLENLYGPATITPVLPSVTTEDGMLEAAAEQTELAAWNFAKMYSYLSTETNTTRIVDVPDTALYYGQLSVIGGQTVVESGELLSAEVANVISKKSDGTVLQTYPIPSEVQALEGYGWSAGKFYNYIDYERKVYVQTVGSVDMGTLSWSKTGSGNYLAIVSGMASVTNNTHATVMPRYQWSNTVGVNKTYWNGNGTIAVRDEDIADAPTFTTAMDGVYLYYKLATPIETDISAYITDTDIKVESSGTLTFDNDNDLDVPSEVRYMS